MLPVIAVLTAYLLAAQGSSLRLYSIPTSEEVRIATMAARDEGYDPSVEGTFLDELRSSDGKQPHAGYLTIGLYSGGRLVHSYSIRIQTGEMVDTRTCQLFDYPDLRQFREKLRSNFGTDPVSTAQIAEEVGCTRIDVVHSPRKAKMVAGRF
jgi:hypothetical protein